MAQCPSCQNELPDDFGLVDCSHCSAGLYIEFDGSVRLREQGGVGTTPVPISHSAHNQNEDMAEQIRVEPPILLETEPEASEIIEEVPLNPLPPMILAEPARTDQVLEDLVAFGNSQVSSSRDGAYFYDLVISGIDSADLRLEVKEALTDQLFLWDAEAMIRTMDLGELVLRQMTSVKAALVVQRLMSLPVKLKWTQHAISEA